MSVTAKCLIESQYAPNVATTVYSTPALTRTIIDKFTATNTDSGAITLDVYLVPSGQSAGGTYQVTKTLSISAGSTTDLSDVKNHILNAGDFISVTSSVASKLVIRASGRECT